MDGQIKFNESLSQRIKMLPLSRDHVLKASKLITKFISKSFLENKEFFSAHAKNIYVISGYRSSKVIYDLKRYGDYIEKSDAYKEGLAKNIKNAVVVPIWEEADYKMSTDSLHLIQSAQKKFADYIGAQIFKETK